METDEKYPLALSKGSILAGQYVIEQVLGQGGFGITYKAVDHKTGQAVAVKEFFPDSMATRTQTTVTAFSGERGESFAYGKACFLQEAETLAQFIGNENIVRVQSYFEENNTAYFVMDFVEGISFDAYIKERGGKISYEEAEKILVPVMDALAAVHSRGIIHRDVTPDNIYITKDGTVKLLDFGAARYSLGDKSRSLDVVLKHGFAPKEQYTRRGKQGAYTDVYTLGASFYFAVTGRRPPDSIDRMEEDELIPPGNLGVSIPRNKEEAILKAMSVQPSERFQSMGAFKQALLGINGTVPQEPVNPKPTEGQPVEQRIFGVPPVTSVPVTETQIPYTASQNMQPIPQTASQMSLQNAQPISQNTQPSAVLPQAEQDKKKKIVWVCVGAGAAAAVLIIMAAVLGGGRAKTVDNKTAHYDRIEDSGSNKQDTLVNPYPTEPVTEPETEKKTYETLIYDGLLGNTSNNLTQKGQIAVDDDIILAYPGGGMACIYDNGDTAFLEEEGVVTCISPAGDTIYYLCNGRAYCMNRYGEEKQLIPELKNYSSINRLYVSEKYYYMHVSLHLYCVNRGSGTGAGHITCALPEKITFLDGNVYYMDSEGKKLYKVPADNISAQPELVYEIKSNRFCQEIASEQDYVYGKCIYEDDKSCGFFQYNVKTDTNKWYHFDKEGWPGVFGELNICDSYIYIDYYTDYSGEGSPTKLVYRFKANHDKEGGTFKPERLYSFESTQKADVALVILQNEQKIAVHVNDDKESLILLNLDGSGEPYVLNDE